MTVARYVIGDVFERMAEIPDGSVDLVVTSPPFLALRSYLPADHPDKAKEIGSEPTPAAFIDTLLRLTAEWGRVLAPHGSLAVELGDTYAGSGGAGGDYSDDGLRAGQNHFDGSASRTRGDGNGKVFRGGQRGPDKAGPDWPLEKSLTLIPGLYAASLAYGRNLLTGAESPAGQLRVRNLVAWVRPNPPVGALGDKYRPATSYITVATRARDRWFDLDAVRSGLQSQAGGSTGTHDRAAGEDRTGRKLVNTGSHPAGAPPLDWWEITPGGYSGAHYAVWPPELCKRLIESMCPRRVCVTCGQPSRRIIDTQCLLDGQPAELPAIGGGERMGEGASGVGHWRKTTERTTTGWSDCGCPGDHWRPGHVLDPFGGSGTTGMVATGLARNCTLIDIDERNAELARERTGMFLDIDPVRSAISSAGGLNPTGDPVPSSADPLAGEGTTRGAP